jgi:hypothetical protein
MKKTLALAPLVLLLGACGGGGGGFDESGVLTLSVTDGPVDGADNVFVTFTGVELRRAGADNLTIDFDEPVRLDLLTLQGTESEFLIQDQAIPAGVYDEVRLFVAGSGNAACNNPGTPPYASSIVIDGIERPLIVPSGGSSGYKIKGGITVAAGGTGNYTVDFDLRQSIVERGSTGCYNLKPVLRVVDNAETGTLTGTVDPALLSTDSGCTADPVTGAGAAVYVYEGSVTPDDFDGLAPGTVGDIGPDPLVTAMLVPPASEGAPFTYTVGFLLAGNYTAAFTCQAGDDVPPNDADVESDNAITFVQPQPAAIVADQVTDVDFTFTPPAPVQAAPAE